MDSSFKIYLKRSENELTLANIIMKISLDDKLQKTIFKTQIATYYSAVISHCYYSIFYLTKAYLLKKGLKTKPPEEHKKTYEEFKKLVEKGFVDVELLKIYQELMLRADILLDIFKLEKSKRGNFTYKTISQANKLPAKESLENARTFFKHMNRLCE